MDRPPKNPLRVLIAVAAVVLAAGVYVVLAWNDVVPGGWTLKRWFEPYEEWEARKQAEHRDRRLAVFAPENASAPEGSILFLGSSTIEYFPLKELFPGVPCLNRGIGNESTTELLGRLSASLPDARPAGAVLYIASIDFRRRGASPDEVAARVWGVARELRARYLDLPIAVIGLLPERGFTSEMVGRLKTANERLAELADKRDLAFVRTARPPIALPDGTLAEEFSIDSLHLNRAGYFHLAEWLRRDGGAVGRLLAR